MVLIRLKAPYVSVIVTVLSTLAEIALLKFFAVVVNLGECQRLQRGKCIDVRLHLRRMKRISILTLAMFFGLEVLFSFYNDPVSNVQFEAHDCVYVSNSVLERGKSTSYLRAADVMVKCRTLENGTITQFGGNFSRRTQQVKCSPHAMYTHPIDDRTINGSIAGVPYRCIHASMGKACLFIQQKGSLSLISEPFYLKDVNNLPAFLKYLPTELHFKAPSNLTLFADRALKAFLSGIAGPAALRRIIYTGTREGTCTFPVVNGTATVVPLAILISLFVVWLIAILLFVLFLFLHKKVIFEIDSAMDWATRSVRSADDPLGYNPQISCVPRGEKLLVQVSTTEKKIESSDAKKDPRMMLNKCISH